MLRQNPNTISSGTQSRPLGTRGSLTIALWMRAPPVLGPWRRHWPRTKTNCRWVPSVRDRLSILL